METEDALSLPASQLSSFSAMSLDTLQPFEIREIFRRSHVPMHGQRVGPDDEVLNAVRVELGKQISEVGVHRIRSM